MQSFSKWLIMFFLLGPSSAGMALGMNIYSGIPGRGFSSIQASYQEASITSRKQVINSASDTTGDSSRHVHSRPGPHWKFTEKGFLTGYGFGINRLSLPEGSYSPLFFMGQLGIQLNGHAKNPAGPVSLMFEPQFNIIQLRNPGSVKTEFEGGIGVGLQQVFNLDTRFKPFIRVVVGPHYISTHTVLQHTGFLFSDNVAAGFYYFFTSRLALQAQFRARHMSNANLMLPNHGINSSNFLGGLSWFL